MLINVGSRRLTSSRAAGRVASELLARSCRRQLVNAREYQAMADRCRELLRIAVRDEVREQLRQWADDFEAEADKITRAVDYGVSAKK